MGKLENPGRSKTESSHVSAAPTSAAGLLIYFQEVRSTAPIIHDAPTPLAASPLPVLLAREYPPLLPSHTLLLPGRCPLHKEAHSGRRTATGRSRLDSPRSKSKTRVEAAWTAFVRNGSFFCAYSSAVFLFSSAS